MRFIPRSVMVGFVNALAILIFIAQLPYLIGVPWLVYPLVAVGIAIIDRTSRGSPRSCPPRWSRSSLLTVFTVARRDRRPDRRRRG